MSEVFWVKLIVKWVIFFGSFSWLWDFLLKNLKFKKNLMMSTGTCEKKFHVRKNTFKKINLNMRFFGTVSGRFSQYFFFNFSTSPSNGGQQFYSPVHPTPHLPQPATIKKLPTALLYMVVPLYYYKKCFCSSNSYFWSQTLKLGNMLLLTWIFQQRSII